MSPAIAQFRRAEIEARITALIDLLDQMDGDPDLEPSLGWTAAIDQTDIVNRHGDCSIAVDAEPNGDELDCSFTDDEFSGRWA